MSTKALVDNAADREQVKEATKQRVRADVQARLDVATILGMPEGRRFFWKLLKDCRTFEISFDRHGSQMSFNEGERNVGNRIYAMLVKEHPEAYLLMQSEAIAAEQAAPEPKPMESTT